MRAGRPRSEGAGARGGVDFRDLFFQIGDALVELGEVGIGGGAFGEACDELGRGGGPRVGKGFADAGFERGEFGTVAREEFGRVDGDLRGAAAGEDAVERVVIALADGIELVIVTAGAGECEALEGFAEDVDLIFHGLHLIIERIDGLEAVFDEAQVGEAEDGFVEVFGGIAARVGEEIAGEMFADELVGGHVGVEGADEIITVAPDVANLGVAFAAVGFGVAHEVHPVARPVFAERGGGEEAVGEGRE